jgi:cytochrome c oxidase accessory protein FixG
MHPDLTELIDTEEENTFRDHIATVDETGRRRWIFPKMTQGVYTRARKYLAWVLIALLFVGPFLRYEGQPFLLFNILERHFIIFGIVFMPQDFHLFVLAMITFVVFIILFTVVWGRLFCGWVCPQTIFMEMVFRKIEYWIEGDGPQQRKLAAAPWTFQKLKKRLFKYGLFYIISFLIGNIFLAYIIGSDEVLKIIGEPISLHMGGFLAMILFSGIFYFVFAYLREQVCIAICPYGRLQGVLLDAHSIVVAYDHVRGEPRTKLSREKKDGGDCIDCKQCLHVCPTGIDIRNGTQLECTNCTACIDACDDIMTKINRPKGLIRYDSHHGILSGSKKIWTNRVKAYTLLLVLLLSVLGFLLGNRGDVELTVMRTPGMLYQERPDGNISNLYNFQIANKTNKPIRITMISNTKYASVDMIGTLTLLKQAEISKGSFFIYIPKNQLKETKTKVNLSILQGDKIIASTTTNFLGPITFK